MKRIIRDRKLTPEEIENDNNIRNKIAEEFPEQIERNHIHKTRVLAYEKWDQAGRPEGKDLDFWLEAEREQFEKHMKFCEISETSVISSTPGVCGGVACVSGTRIAVWVLESARKRGDNIADVIENYPSLSENDVIEAWRYARSHSREISQQIQRNTYDGCA